MTSAERYAELGLRRSTVKLSENHFAWQSAFREKRDRLADVPGLEEVLLKHIGSTSIPGLLAKPILDIAALITREERMVAFSTALISNGYKDRGDKGQDGGGHLFVFEKSPDVRSIHVHALIDGGPQWHEYRRFRDALRSDETLRDEYASLKSRLAKALPHNRAAYTAGKNAFIQRVLTAFDG